MKCIIYLGHHKTGSSALQELFTRHAATLAAQGVLYPFIEPVGTRYAAALVPGQAHQGKLTARIKSPHNHIAYQMMAEKVPGYTVPKRFGKLPATWQMFDDLRAQIAKTRPHTLLLCSEVFSHFGLRDHDLIRGLLAAVGATDVTLYMVLRRVDLHVAAWHSQMLKFGRSPKKLSAGGMARFYGTSHFEFDQAASPWAAAVPQGRFHLHTYDAVLAAGGSVPHFAQSVGLDVSGLGQTSLTTNPSIPYAFYDLIAAANHDLPPRNAARLRDLLSDRRADLSVTPNSEVELFGPVVRAQMQKRFAPVAAELAQISGRDPFFANLDQIGTQRLVPEAEAAAAATALAVQILPDFLPVGTLRAWLRRQG